MHIDGDIDFTKGVTEKIKAAGSASTGSRWQQLYVTVSVAVAAAALSQGLIHYLTFINTNLHQLNIIHSRDYVIFYYDNK